MFTRFGGGAAALFAACAIAAAPAHAQTGPGDLTSAQEDEMYCVYDILVDDFTYYEVADAFLAGETEGEQFEDAAEIVDDAIAECVSTYKWDDEKQEIAGTIGVYGAVSDTLMEDLYDAGLDDGAFDKIMTVLDGLSGADVDALYDASWLDKADVKARMTAALNAAGVQGDKSTMDDVMFFMEASVVSFFTIDDWIALLDS